MSKARLSIFALLIVVGQAVALTQQGVPALKVIALLVLGPLHRT